MITNEYLNNFKDNLDVDTILHISELSKKQLKSKKLSKFFDALECLPYFKSKVFEITDGVVKVGSKSELTLPQDQLVTNAIKTFIPWKKGPFEIFGNLIDSEWRSDLKWERFKKNIGNLKGKRVADIGCHNGYFLYRIAEDDPELVVGFEPYGKHWYNFNLIQRFAQVPNIYFELLGVEHMDLYPDFFDRVFCLGILYHHSDPVGILKKIHSSLRTGGELYIDCQGIPGEEPYILVPEQRYAQARGVWNLPTLSALKIWLKRTNFRDIKCIYSQPLRSDEQRKTAWAPIKSLEDFLDPNDKSKTVEGYPAPWRFYIKAKR